MRRFKALVIAWIVAALAAVALLATAQAADMPRSWPPEIEKPPLVATEFVSGWYLRGDVGYRYNRLRRIEAEPPVTSYSYDNTYAVGIGAGYKWKWFRSDVTLDYGARTKVEANTAPGPAFYRAKIDTFTALANIYLDLGSWGGLTPYVGAGAGVSRLNVTDFTTAGVSSTTAAADVWGLSWALMAGLSYQLLPNFAVDLGYRYLSLGDAMTAPDALGRRVAFKDLTSQEVRVGFRLLID